MESPPPIVLVVGMQDDACDPSYATVLEEAGFWVARSESLEAAVDDIVELRPNVVITRLTAAAERQADALVRTL